MPATVPDADAKAAAKAVKRLGGMRLCATGNEDHVTHLVMGSSRRTLKVSRPGSTLLQAIPAFRQLDRLLTVLLFAFASKGLQLP